MKEQKNSFRKLMLDLDGNVLTNDEIDLLRNPFVGGVILFSRNIASKSQVQALCEHIKFINSELLIAVDQEGGRVQRLQKGYTRLPSMQQLSDHCSKDNFANIDLARDTGWLMASEVIASGLDISFAPVLDLDIQRSSIIGDRSFGDVPERVIEIVNLFIDGMNEAGMQAVGKHFPGHGGIYADSHLVLAEDFRCLEELEKHDLLPFSALKDKLGGIMTAHISFPKIDTNIATFSKFWLKDFLRNEIKFSGAIFSDDLSMKGADYAGGIEAKVSKALESGCDMVLVCNDRPAALEVINFLENKKISQSYKATKLKASQSISWADLEKDSRRIDIIDKLNSI
ncbi:beta-N-acetylhexosaminidase [Gammaproteobacteria bacterium]|jgi:beta-N-acetylhexosaminidase|nr:beta-N-acetylhexosaminidase [Gammaproteobacteria bacterium]